MSNEWTTYTDESINDATPEQWDKASKTVYGKLAHPSDAAMKRQVGGNHYKKFKIQPLQYALDNGLGICEHAVIKYVTRWRDKGGVEDLRKAIHYIEVLIQREIQ